MAGSLSRVEVTKRIRIAERSFLRVYEQIEVLQCRIGSWSQRLDKADATRRQAFKASLQLRLTVSEGVLAAYVEFAGLQMEKIERLQTMLLAMMPTSVTMPTDGHMGYNSCDDMFER
jgi:hypothetical protein